MNGRVLLMVVMRRLALAVVIAVLVASITFVVARVLPGDPAVLLAGPAATPETIANIKRQLGLDDPIAVQYVNYLKDLAQLDLGVSTRTGSRVVDDLATRLPATLELTLAALILGTVSGILLGVHGAIRTSGLGAAIGRILTTVGAAIPEFWLGLVMISVFYVELGIAPAPVGRLSIGTITNDVTGFVVIDSLLTGDGGAFVDGVGHLLMPASVLAFLVLAPIARVTRATMRNVLTEPFVLAARANGDRGLSLFLGRVLPVALPSVLTVIALVIGFLLAGAALVEKVFAWPGLGLYGVQAVQFGDFAALQGVVLLVAIAYVTIFLITDICVAILDPRTQSHLLEER